MIGAAVAAQQKGFHVFPVAPMGKVPHRAVGKWGEAATNDLNAIVSFWGQEPTANIGVACKPSELLVIDLDVAKAPRMLDGTEWEYLHSGYGGYVHGEDLFDEMAYKLSGRAAWHVDLDTFRVRTGSGGLHLYYRWPTYLPKISQASPVKGLVDVRGNGGQYGGYVLAAGSATEAGSYEVECDSPVKLAPEWVRKLVAEKPVAPKPPRLQNGLRQPSAVSWSGLVDSVRSAGEGNRNNALLWAARAMCSDGASEGEAQSTLGPAALGAGLSDFETRRTIQSAYRIQRQKEGK